MPTINDSKTNPMSLVRIGRIAGAIILIAVLFSATMHNEALYALFGEFWHNVFAVSSAPAAPAATSTSSEIGQITNTPRNAFAVLTYGLLYLSICLALLFLLLPSPHQRRLAVTTYVLAVGGFLVLLVIGKLGSTVALVLSSQLIHFIISPMPIIILVPLLRWYLPHKVSV